MREVVRRTASVVDGLLRSGGVVANLATLALYVCVFIWAKAGVMENLANIGPLPALNPASAVALGHDPAIVAKLLALAKIWGFGIVALGSAWMALLGGRWAFHALLALLQRLKTI